MLCKIAGVCLLSVVTTSAQTVVPSPPPAPPAASVEEPRPDFTDFVSALKQQAIAAGVTEATTNAALDGLEPLEIVIERDRSQPEVVLSTEAYVQRQLTRQFVRTAAEKLKEQRATLAPIAKKYGVPSNVLVAIWGM